MRAHNLSNILSAYAAGAARIVCFRCRQLRPLAPDAQQDDVCAACLRTLRAESGVLPAAKPARRVYDDVELALREALGAGPRVVRPREERPAGATRERALRHAAATGYARAWGLRAS